MYSQNTKLFQFYQVRFKRQGNSFDLNLETSFNSIKYDLNNIKQKILTNKKECFNSIKYDLNRWMISTNQH